MDLLQKKICKKNCKNRTQCGPSPHTTAALNCVVELEEKFTCCDFTSMAMAWYSQCARVGSSRPLLRRWCWQLQYYYFTGVCTRQKGHYQGSSTSVCTVMMLRRIQHQSTGGLTCPSSSSSSAARVYFLPTTTILALRSIPLAWRHGLWIETERERSVYQG